MFIFLFLAAFLIFCDIYGEDENKKKELEELQQIRKLLEQKNNRY
jgi:hypothetical protein